MKNYSDAVMVANPDAYVVLPVSLSHEQSNTLELSWVLGAPGPYQDLDETYTRRILNQRSLLGYLPDGTAYMVQQHLMFADYDDAADFAEAMTLGHKSRKLRKSLGMSDATISN